MALLGRPAVQGTIHAQRLVGTVASWKSPWGWVNCPSLGGDLFAHEEDLVSGILAKGVQVSFEAGTDPRSGRPRALQIEALGDGVGHVANSASAGLQTFGAFAAKAEPLESSGPRFDGVIASWKEPWGWISCSQEEKDVFVHREDMLGADPCIPLEAGLEVTFEMGLDPKTGRKRALRIEVPSLENRLNGVVTSWKDQWGWVSCAEFQDGDIFAHREDLPDGAWVEVGTPVTFELGADDKGRRRAKRIGVCGPAVAPLGKGGCMPNTLPTAPVKGAFKGNSMGSHTMPVGPGKGCGASSAAAFAAASVQGCGSLGCSASGGKGHAKGDMVQVVYVPVPAAGAPKGGVRKGTVAGPAGFVGQRLNGLVASWKDAWGWISNPLFGTDIFAHSEDVAEGTELAIGSPVVFTVGKDVKGRIRARQIEPPGGGAGDGTSAQKRKELQGREGQALEGVVISWKSPWGWIRASGIEGDLFAHLGDVPSGEELTVGQTVSFVVGRDQKTQRYRAVHIVASPNVGVDTLDIDDEESALKRPRI